MRRTAKGFAYTMEAAAAALEAYAFNNAVVQLKEAQQLLPTDAAEATRYRLWDMLGMLADRRLGSTRRSRLTHRPSHTPGTALIVQPLNTGSARRITGRVTTPMPTAISKSP